MFEKIFVLQTSNEVVVNKFIGLKMPRLARVVIPGIPHHITQRGNRNQDVFFRGDDKSYYIEFLRKEAKRAKIAIWTYCLMDNHIHLIAVPETKEALTKGISETHKKYTRMINSRYEWKGHLWQGRFFSCPMDESHLYTAVRYIEQNPVRAGIAKKAEDYYWSSARSHVFGEPDVLLSDFHLLSSIPDWREYLREQTTQSDKKLIRSHTRTGRPLGDDKFIAKLERITGRTLRKKKPGRKKRED